MLLSVAVAITVLLSVSVIAAVFSVSIVIAVFPLFHVQAVDYGTQVMCIRDRRLLEDWLKIHS